MPSLSVTKGDFAIMAAAVLLALAVFFGTFNSFSDQTRAQLVVKQGTKELMRTTITAEDKKTLKVQLDIGYTAEIEVAHGKARLKPMPDWVCPRHICSDTGWISMNGGQAIICAPNRLIIYFEHSTELDGVACFSVVHNLTASPESSRYR